MASRRRNLALGLLLAIAVAGLAAILLGDGGDGGAARQPVIGTWQLPSLGPAPGPWTLRLDETHLTTTGPDGRSIRTAMQRQPVDDLHAILRLDPPHPILGRTIRLSGLQMDLEILTDGETGSR